MDEILDIIGKYTLHVIGFLFIVLFYFIGTTIMTMLIDKIFPGIKNITQKSKILILFEIICQIALIGIGLYYVKLLSLSIPFPLDNMYDYNHNIQNSNAEMLLTITVFMYQQELMKKIKYFVNSFNIRKIDY